MRFWLNSHFWAILFLIVLSIPALKSLSLDGFYTSHDGITHTARIAQYYKALKDGQLPPRFADSFYNGIGSPIFVYIYPLPYLLGAAIHALGFSFVNSFKILMAAGFVFSATFSYLWLNEVFKSKRAALVGAIFYVWVPYRFSLIYVRASLSEHLAYTFLPLLLFFITKLNRSPRPFGRGSLFLAQDSLQLGLESRSFFARNKKFSLKLVAATAVSFALVLLSQNLVALISIPVVLGYALVLGFLSKSFKYFFLVVAASLWGFAISSFIYLPSLLERKFVKIDDLIQHQFVHHFITIKQLIRSPWGYGFDLSGVANDQMSFQIGLAHILVFLIFLGLVIWWLFARKSFFFLNKPSKETKTISLYFLFIISLFTLMMLQSDIVKFIWEKVRPLQIIDIPWRLLGVISIGSSFLAAFATKNIKSGIFAVFLILAVIVANRNHLKINQKILYSDEYFLNYTDTATQYGEFSTIWSGYLSKPEQINPNIKFETILGHAQIKDQFSKSNKLEFTADVHSQKAFIKINKIYFPGVRVNLDEKKLEPFSGVIIPTGNFANSDKYNGLMIIPLNEGSHKVKVLFKETMLRQFADFLSLGSFLAAFGSIIFFRKRV